MCLRSKQVTEKLQPGLIWDSRCIPEYHLGLLRSICCPSPCSLFSQWEWGQIDGTAGTSRWPGAWALAGLKVSYHHPCATKERGTLALLSYLPFCACVCNVVQVFSSCALQYLPHSSEISLHPFLLSINMNKVMFSPVQVVRRENNIVKVIISRKFRVGWDQAIKIIPHHDAISRIGLWTPFSPSYIHEKNSQEMHRAACRRAEFIKGQLDYMAEEDGGSGQGKSSPLQSRTLSQAKIGQQPKRPWCPPNI